MKKAFQDKQETLKQRLNNQLKMTQDYTIGKEFYHDIIALGLPTLPDSLRLDHTSSASIPVARDSIGLHYRPINGAWTLQDKD